MSASQDKKLREIADKFKRDMEKLGLGVNIQVGDGPMVEVVPPPADEKPEGEA